MRRWVGVLVLIVALAALAISTRAHPKILIDTADVYGLHTNESLIRNALDPYLAELVIATKRGFVRGRTELSSIAAIGNPHYLHALLPAFPDGRTGRSRPVGRWSNETCQFQWLVGWGHVEAEPVQRLLVTW